MMDITVFPKGFPSSRTSDINITWTERANIR